MQKIWTLRTNNKRLREKLSGHLNISPILAQMLINRDLCDAQQARHFLYGDLSACFDPFLLKGMDEACRRVKKAIKNKEKILIYGDYDVDGITSCALLKIVLHELGADAYTYIPNRLEEGYGLNRKAVKSARDKHIKLIITVDCGIGAVEEVGLANSFGIDVIITDHHQTKKDGMPGAFCIINPHQKGCAYPFKHLAGVGLAYKLSQALMKKRYYFLEKHLDLIALGTVADVAPQKSENRIFTKHGIFRLNDTQNLGLKSLIAVSGLGKRDISSSHIGYILGPRINA
ncbi:MAG: DHH family phosphoesterase, partial [Candidatus Omnitrophica bacterium]|nr:DHH family phosphoesterase [Candidatus Omnitrophota bacterium]